MKRCNELSRFIAAPVGSYVAGKTWIVWCARADLAGAFVWGHHSETDAAELVAALRVTTALAKPYDFVSDFSRVAAINIAAFEVLLQDVRRQRDVYYQSTRTSVLVRPSGFASALATGAFRLYATTTEWRIFGGQEVGSTAKGGPTDPWRRSWKIVDTTEQGFAALDRSDSELAQRAVEACFAAEASTDVEIATLHSLLLRTPSLTLAEAAKRLKVSERSLQRKLEDVGTNFRKLSSDSKLQEARRLLEGTDEKLSEIARRVGLSSAEQLNKLFRNQVGESPSTIRKRARGGQ